MIYESYLGGVLIHHGVKGMRWGVRRTPEQLGHVTNSAVANAEEAVKIVDGVYQSSKGFTVKQNKFTEWCLKAGTDHADEFFSVGYKTTDADRLFRVSLGVTAQRLFRTVWQKDGPESSSRFVTAYIDRRLEED